MAKLVLDFEKSDGTKMQITDDDIMSVNSLSQSTSDSSTINYGSIASTGSITIQDKWNQLEEMVLNGDIPASNAKIDLVVNDNVLQSHISSDSSFDDSLNELNITLTNKIGAWDELKYDGYPYPNESRTLYEVLSSVLSSLGYTQSQIEHSTSTQIVYTGANDDGSKTTNTGSVSDYLKKIKLEYPVIEYGKTYRQVIDEICVVAQLRCFIDDENNLKFISGRPLVSELDTPIEIPLSVVLDDITGDLFIKNKYDSVEITENQVNDELQYNEKLFTTSPIPSTPARFEMLSSFHYSSPNVSYNMSVDTSGISLLGIARYKKVAVSLTAIKGYYLSGSFTIPINTENNLHQVKEVYNRVFNSDGNPHFNLRCLKQQGSCSCMVKPSTKDIISNFNLSLPDNMNYGTEFFGYPSQEVSYTYNAGGLFEVGATSNTKNIDSSYINITKNDEAGVYVIKYNILVGQDIAKMGGAYTITASELEDDVSNITINGLCERYVPVSVEISVFGVKRIISFSSNSGQSLEEQKSTTAVVQSSSLLQDKTTFDGKVKMSEIIKHNILSDYENGTKNISLKTVCYDLYNSDGEKSVNFKNGEVLQNGNLVYLKGDNSKIYSIYSRDFIYDGSPETSLMIESTKIVPYYGLYNNDLMVYNWNDLLKTGKIIVVDSEITSQSIEESDGDKIVIKNGITTLTDSLFNESSAIKEVVLPSSLKKISSSAFRMCSNLTHINIPTNLERIDSYAFTNCTSMNSIYVPSTVSGVNGVIGGAPFLGCSNLTIYTNIENKFDINSFNTTGAYTYNCNIAETNNALYMTSTSTRNNPYADILTLTLDAGDWTYSCGSSDLFAIVAVVNGVEQDIEWVNARNKSVHNLHLSESSSVTIRIYGNKTMTQSQAFMDVILTKGKSTDSINSICNWDYGWSVYYSMAIPMKNIPVKYGYSLDQYKSEVGVD